MSTGEENQITRPRRGPWVWLRWIGVGGSGYLGATHLSWAVPDAASLALGLIMLLMLTDCMLQLKAQRHRSRADTAWVNLRRRFIGVAVGALVVLMQVVFGPLHVAPALVVAIAILLAWWYLWTRFAYADWRQDHGFTESAVPTRARQTTGFFRLPDAIWEGGPEKGYTDVTRVCGFVLFALFALALLQPAWPSWAEIFVPRPVSPPEMPNQRMAPVPKDAAAHTASSSTPVSTDKRAGLHLPEAGRSTSATGRSCTYATTLTDLKLMGSPDARALVEVWSHAGGAKQLGCLVGKQEPVGHFVLFLLTTGSLLVAQDGDDTVIFVEMVPEFRRRSRAVTTILPRVDFGKGQYQALRRADGGHELLWRSYPAPVTGPEPSAREAQLLPNALAEIAVVYAVTHRAIPIIDSIESLPDGAHRLTLDFWIVATDRMPEGQAFERFARHQATTHHDSLPDTDIPVVRPVDWHHDLAALAEIADTFRRADRPAT